MIYQGQQYSDKRIAYAVFFEKSFLVSVENAGDSEGGSKMREMW